MKKLFLIILSVICFLNSFTQTGLSSAWTWIKGDSTGNQVGIYGTQGIGAAINKPESMDNCATWTDASGNFWLFGGNKNGFLKYNVLWKYDPTSNIWTWMKGTTATNQPGIYGTKGIPNALNTPGCRALSAYWSDNNGNLWLFGGLGYAETGNGRLNDLWKYNIATNEWTWINGSKTIEPVAEYGTKGISSPNNTPGGRFGQGCIKDQDGNFWLLGGNGRISLSFSGILNDLWKYNPVTNEWTWMSGDNVSYQNGVYGTQGVPNAANKPGSRLVPCIWSNAGNIWMFGGFGFSVNSSSQLPLSDLWKYNIATNEWTWLKGDNTAEQPGVYGTQGVPNPLNKPGARDGVANWKDNDGNFWLWGGYIGDLYSDLWKYDIATNNWTWIKGNNTFNQNGIYGSLGTPQTTNNPGARYGIMSWTDNAQNFWLFGGRGYAASGDKVFLNDLWKINTNGLTMIAINLKLFLQGFYAGGIMLPVLENQGTGTNATAVDSITVELHDPATSELVASKKGILRTDGNISVSILQASGPYYIAVKHRSSISTWTSSPVNCSVNTPLYDFSISSSQALGNNQVMVEPGVFAFYTGDFNQDGFIDGNDFPLFDIDSYNGVNGIYVVTDLNGDGFVDGNDYPIFDSNSFNGISAIVP